MLFELKAERQKLKALLSTIQLFVYFFLINTLLSSNSAFIFQL